VPDQDATRKFRLNDLIPAIAAIAGVFIGGLITVHVEDSRAAHDARSQAVERRLAAYEDFLKTFNHLLYNAPEVVVHRIDLNSLQEASKSHPVAPDSSAELAKAMGQSEADQASADADFKALLDEESIISVVGSDTATTDLTVVMKAAGDLFVALGKLDTLTEQKAVVDVIKRAVDANAKFSVDIQSEIRRLGASPP
jgi:hypothetical protein